MVIAILASITVVAYTGVSQNAQNSSIVSGVRQYYNAVKSYYALNGTYPTNTRMSSGENIAMSCLGGGYVDNTACEIILEEVPNDISDT